VLAKEDPFTNIKENQETEKQKTDILKGLVEEVKALCKEVAPKTYTEKLKKGLTPPTLPLLSFSFSSSPFPLTNKTTNNTKGKKKQLQERRLVLVTNQKDQPLDIFTIRNKVNQLFTSKLQTEKPVLASITRTKQQQHILLTTTAEYNADFLIKNKEIRSTCFSFQRE